MAATEKKSTFYYFLKVGNILVLIFWVLYFVDGMLTPGISTEILLNYERSGLQGSTGKARSSDKPYENLETNRRNFNIYEEDNVFSVGDTLELTTTPVFDVVKKFRKYSPNAPEEWVVNKLSRYKSPVIIIGAVLLVIFAIFVTVVYMEKNNFYVLSLFSIAGALVYFISIYI